jgi:hypothetical protein
VALQRFSQTVGLKVPVGARSKHRCYPDSVNMHLLLSDLENDNPSGHRSRPRPSDIQYRDRQGRRTHSPDDESAHRNLSGFRNRKIHT